MNAIKIKDELKPFLLATIFVFVFAAFLTSGAEKSLANVGESSEHHEKANPADHEVRNAPVGEKVTRQGISIEFSANPSSERSLNGKEIFAADYVDMSFRITDAVSGQPLKGQFPGAWMDLSRTWEGDHALDTTCKERVGTYLQGALGIRPMIDLNSYFILVMNRDNSIAVIDPITGVKGITKLYAQIYLKKPGGDWSKSKDEKLLFVSMPMAEAVAVVDTDTFKVVRNVEAGKMPLRIKTQPDGKYVWVGNNADDPADSGVTVIDAEKMTAVKFIATGTGHHEIAFSDDSRYAFVTNRKGGSLSVIDIAKLEKVTDVATGPQPISIAFSVLAKSLYVADGKKGEITVVDGGNHKPTARISLKPGLGQLGFSQDGRWAVVLNSSEDVAYVIDPSINSVAHKIDVGKQPYQIAFSRNFAYVRSLGTERVAMINLSRLGKKGTVPVVTFAAGRHAPEDAVEISIADAIVEAPGEAAVMVVSPADATVYYYMEGMNAPMGNFRNYGHLPRAVQVVDRSMREKEPGVYSSTVRLPESGTYEVAFLLDSPSVLHCFEVSAGPNPVLTPEGPSLSVEFLNENRKANVGENFRLRFRLLEQKTEKVRTDLPDVRVSYFLSPGGRRIETSAVHSGEGVYETNLSILSTGAYYVYVAVPSEKISFGELQYATLIGTDGSSSERTATRKTTSKENARSTGEKQLENN